MASFSILCLASNLASQLYPQVPEDAIVSPGILTIGNLAAGWVTFPDIAVLPKPRAYDPLDRNVVTNPSILIEVTSDMAERVDRGIKLRLYRDMRSVTPWPSSPIAARTSKSTGGSKASGR